MSKLEIAARLALVSLEHAPQKSIKQRQAITALKEALDPEKQEPTQDEPVDISDTLDAEAFLDLRLPMDIRIGCGVNKAGTTIRALLLRFNALPQIETKQDEAPVGTLDHNGNFKLLRMVGIPISQPMKLYEHPAPRPEFVRLSEEEIVSWWGVATEAGLIEFARAIEDALEEKNRG